MRIQKLTYFRTFLDDAKRAAWAWWQQRGQRDRRRQWRHRIPCGLGVPMRHWNKIQICEERGVAKAADEGDEDEEADRRSDGLERASGIFSASSSVCLPLLLLACVAMEIKSIYAVACICTCIESFQFGSARFGSVWFGSVWFGLATIACSLPLWWWN